MKHLFLVLVLLFYTTTLFGQERIISGTVLDENGSPLPGANILIKGTNRGTATDMNGHYSIGAEAGEAVLIFSFVGYINKEMTTGLIDLIDVQLTPDSNLLQEIIVMGYSSLEKKDLSSSVTTVDTKDMMKISASNFAEQLEGKVSGVQILNSGDPGSFQFVRVRGIGSINNNEPLYIIDGVPVQNETNMNFLNPGDIESMQVLKDAAAASIYGARATNGVIVITTKKGKGKSKLNIDFFTGTQQSSNFPQMPNPSEQLQLDLGKALGAGLDFSKSQTLYIQDAQGNWILPDYYVVNNSKIIGYPSGDPAVDPSKYKLNTDPTADNYNDNYLISKANKNGTDWFRELFKPASFTRFDLSTSSGGEKGNYYFSAGYYDYNGFMIYNSYQRFQTRANTSFNIGKNIRIGENLNISYQQTKGPNGNADEYSGYSAQMLQLYDVTTISPVYDINGYWAQPVIDGGGNNVVAAKYREWDGIKGHTQRLTGNVFGEFDFLKNFTFKTSFGLDYYEGPFELYVPTSPEAASISSKNSLSNSWQNNRSWVWYNTVTYNRTFGDHSVSALAGAEARDVFTENFNASGTTLKYGDDPNFRILDNVQNISQPKSFKSDNRLTSLFINANYNYRDRYLLNATVRRDGSSRFRNNKYGTFPAASVAWRISKEDFFQDVQFVTDLKLRASYGITGNNEVFGGDYPGYTSYIQANGSSSYDINGTQNSIVPGFYQVSTGNPNLKWETSTMTNIAFDLTVLNNLDLTVEWYTRTTRDMIYPVEQPLESGLIGRVNQNIGSMLNKGIDLQLNYRGHISNTLNYNIGLTGTHYTNKVQTLDANQNTFVNTGYTQTQAGYPISQFYGYVADGIWQSQQQIDAELPNDTTDFAKPGRMRFIDVNKDGKINENDNTLIGSPLPAFLLGLNLTVNYGRFDFNVFINGMYGQKIYNISRDKIVQRDLLTEAGKTLPALDATDSYSYHQSSFYVEDGSFTRLRNVLVGYTIPTSASSRIGLSRVRIYLQGQNLFTFTKYTGLDPGVSVVNVKNGNTAQRDLMMGVDYGRYPSPRQFIIGCNLEF